MVFVWHLLNVADRKNLLGGKVNEEAEEELARLSGPRVFHTFFLNGVLVVQLFDF